MIRQDVPSASALPNDWYFDLATLHMEQRSIFGRAPQYVGSDLTVPRKNDYHALERLGGACALVRNEDGVDLISNLCRHRQAVMLRGRGNAARIVCPLHRWSYDTNGTLIHAPQFERHPCLNLGRTPLCVWNHLLFRGPGDPGEDLAEISVASAMSLDGYAYDRTVAREYAFNWKVFVEVYLDDYHIGPFHPGLRNLLDVRKFRWEFGPRHSVQIFQLREGLEKHGTPTYREWQRALVACRGDRLPKHGAIWALYYPSTMIERYPDMTVVSTALPLGPSRCVNRVEFYHPEELLASNRPLIELAQAAYNETAQEDEEICARIYAGRRAMREEGRDEAGPYQTPLEEGIPHFNRYVRGCFDFDNTSPREGARGI
jgi:choline monooxygenase